MARTRGLRPPARARHRLHRPPARRELLKLPPGTLVVQAKDPEGNGFSLVADIDVPCAYRQGQWGGEIAKGTGAVCLWPLD